MMRVEQSVEMRIGSGNRSTRRKPAPMPLCRPQIPHDLLSNPGRRGGKPATNRMSYGTALDVNATIGEFHSCQFTLRPALLTGINTFLDGSRQIFCEERP
jgi:hypothetical protein